MPARKTVGEEEIEQRPHAAEQQKESASVEQPRYEKTEQQRERANDSIKTLPEETVRARGEREGGRLIRNMS